MLSAILRYGTIAGLIAGILLFAMTRAMQGHPNSDYGVVIGYLTMLIALSTIFVAIKRRRDHDQGGVIGFWPALGLGLGITGIAGLFYVAAWEATLATMKIDFANAWADALIAEQRALGVRGAALDRFVAQMARFRRDYANPLYRIPMTFSEIVPVGALVSLVSAALLRDSRFLPARRQG